MTPGPTLEPTSIADVCDQEQEWDVQLDLDGDGSTDRVTLAARTIDAWGQLVACLADGTTTALAVGPGLDLVRVGRLALRPIDLAGTPGVALVRLLGSERDSGENEVFVLRDQELVALTPNETSGAFGGTLLDLRLWGTTRVETFGCRPTNSGGVEIVELLIEQVDRNTSDDIASPVYSGDGMALSYVVRAVASDWSGIDGPGERTELPLDPGEAVSPAEILAGLDAVWLCAP